MVARPEDRHPEADAEDGVRWLALLIRQGLLLICAGIEVRYGLRRVPRLTEPAAARTLIGDE